MSRLRVIRGIAVLAALVVLLLAARVGGTRLRGPGTDTAAPVLGALDRHRPVPAPFLATAFRIVESQEEIARALAAAPETALHTAPLVLAGDVFDVALPPQSAPSQWSVRLVLRGPARVAFEVTTDAAGILVTRDAWTPGWNVYVRGVRRPVFPAFHALRSVAVPQGTNVDVEFRYEPGLAGGLLPPRGCPALRSCDDTVVRVADTTPARAPSPAPHLIGQWQATGPMTTDAFTLGGLERFNWQISEARADSVFQAWLYRDDASYATQLAHHQGSNAARSVFVRPPPGTYRLAINAVAASWQANLEEQAAGASGR